MSTLDAEAQEAMRRLRIGILTLISGSDEFFVIVVCDKGYVFVPGNAATDFITFLKDLCRQVKMRLEKPARNNSDIFFIFQVGAPFLAPIVGIPEYIFQTNRQGLIALKSTAGLVGLDSLILNHNALVSFVRKAVEQGNCLKSISFHFHKSMLFLRL